MAFNVRSSLLGSLRRRLGSVRLYRTGDANDTSQIAASQLRFSLVFPLIQRPGRIPCEAVLWTNRIPKLLLGSQATLHLVSPFGVFDDPSRAFPDPVCQGPFCGVFIGLGLSYLTALPRRSLLP
jgi:hypothetical protein